MKLWVKPFGLLPGLLLLTACAHMEPDKTALRVLSADLPQKFAEDNTTADIMPRMDRWWTAFGDEELSRLVDQALSGNLTIQQADARLRQAWAVAVKTGADQFPAVSLDAGVALSENQAEERTSTENWRAGLAGSYEVDLWGRVHALHEASLRDTQASMEDRNAAGMTVAAETVLTYFSMISARETLDLLQQQLDAAHHILQLLEVRYRRSQASLLDVLQQRQTVAQLESLIPSARANEQTQRSALTVLTGGALSNETVFSMRMLPELPALPETGIPADLLIHRPDIRSAAADWMAVSWRESAAQADRLPALRLTAGANLYGDTLANVMDNWLANLAAGLTGPIIDGGKRRAEVRRIRALMDERLAAYELVVIQALRDVQDALIQETEQQHTLDLQTKQLELARKTYAEAMTRYSRGLESYLSALSAEVSRYALERNLVNSRYQLLAYRVKLYRTLGGNWEQIMNERAQETTDAGR